MRVLDLGCPQRTEAGIEHGNAEGAEPSRAMLEADQGEYLTFALVAARKPTDAD